MNLSHEFARRHEIGIVPGETLFSGCVTFTIRSEIGLKVGYYGLSIQAVQPVYDHSFHPELYLYNYHNIDPTESVIFTNSLLNWILFATSDYFKHNQIIAAFGQPTLSARQWRLLRCLAAVAFMGPYDEIQSLINQAEKYLYTPVTEPD
jgi:hypothetical protein